jgi:hypothetical protein
MLPYSKNKKKKKKKKKALILFFLFSNRIYAKKTVLIFLRKISFSGGA